MGTIDIAVFSYYDKIVSGKKKPLKKNTADLEICFDPYQQHEDIFIYHDLVTTTVAPKTSPLQG